MDNFFNEKYNKIVLVSNPKSVLKNYRNYLQKHKLNEDIHKLYYSYKKDKKYMISLEDGRFIHFGSMSYEDYTFHQNDIRKENYLKRSNKIRGNWKNNIFSPNNLSINLLWK